MGAPVVKRALVRCEFRIVERRMNFKLLDKWCNAFFNKISMRNKKKQNFPSEFWVNGKQIPTLLPLWHTLISTFSTRTMYHEKWKKYHQHIQIFSRKAAVERNGVIKSINNLFADFMCVPFGFSCARVCWTPKLLFEWKICFTEKKLFILWKNSVKGVKICCHQDGIWRLFSHQLENSIKHFPTICFRLFPKSLQQPNLAKNFWWSWCPHGIRISHSYSKYFMAACVIRHGIRGISSAISAEHLKCKEKPDESGLLFI